MRRITLALIAVLAPGLARAAEPDWVGPMKAVHGKFTGQPGTLALFGDSITISLAFWSPLQGEPKNMSDEMKVAHGLVKKHMSALCWSKWRGPKFGNNGSMTIRWAHENVDTWLKELNPEAAVIMFGSNDLGQLDRKEYEQKTADVVDRCLQNGTIVLLTTPPPRSGLLEQSKEFADAVRRVAKEKRVPLIDYQAEILKRRPDDWDGASPRFKDSKGSEYDVPTLICRDGVHPSNPRAHQDYSPDSLTKNGFALRNYLTLMSYADVVRQTLSIDESALRKAVTFYASFDAEVRGDRGGGDLALQTRFNREKEKSEFDFEKGFDAKIFRIARDKGIHGGALEATDVLPRNGRIYFPAKGNIAFKKGGWGGAVSLWCNTDPSTMLKTRFCDPIQITHKGAGNGGLWFDFNDAKPRDLRHGAFPAVPEGSKAIAESDPKAPLVRVPGIGWKSGEWHHVVMSWSNFDTGKANAVSALYIDGKRIGEMKDREIAMDWDMDKAGIYVAVNYIGLLDELAIFNRPLTADEIKTLHAKPGLVGGKK
jgi:lysophospholipase L1-like esterase